MATTKVSALSALTAPDGAEELLINDGGTSKKITITNVSKLNLKGGDLTSASPLVIDTDGNYFDVTGTTNFAVMTVAANRQFTLQFDGALTMTHHATNIDLPGAANITTAAGDVATFQSTGANTVQCINYTRAAGTPIAIANDSIDSQHYVDGSIDNAHIADDAIDSEHYADGSIDTAHLANDAITGAKIADDAIDSEHYTDGSIDNAHIADDAIDSEHYADGSIDNAHIADDAIDSEHYVDGSIDTAHLANDAITGAKIADDAIDSEHYTDGSIDNAHIADDAIDSEHYADGSIDNAHIADDAIDSEHYVDGSIDTAHLANDAVTGAKIADDAIDSEHYTDGSIDNAHIADDAIDSEHYADGSIDNAHIADDAIDSEHYAAGSIDTAHIADSQVTLAKTTGLVGKQTIWIPSNAMTPTESNGCSAITAVETTSGRPDMYVLDFDKDSDEFAQFSIAFPNSWNLGTVTYQAFWSGIAATTEVDWMVDAVAMNDNQTIDVAYGTAIVVTDAAQGAVEELLVSAESGAVTIAGTPADGDLTYFRIGRDVSGDDMAGDARLHGVKVFFTTDALNDS